VGRGAETGEGGEVGVDDLKRRRFLWGVVLAWAPWIPILAGIAYAFRGIWEQKATGLGAVAGGLSEIFVLYGVSAILVGQVASIFLLFQTFSPGHWVRSLFSVLSICLSGLMLLLVGFFLWFSWFRIHRNF
jgi:hypothetical protein